MDADKKEKIWTVFNEFFKTLLKRKEEEIMQNREMEQVNIAVGGTGMKPIGVAHTADATLDLFGGFPTSPQTVSILINPKLAEAWLERNKKPGIVRRYAGDMKRGRWKLTGDTIKFDWNGVLIDGQHRLLAIIESSVSVRSDVRFGLDPEVFVNIDTQARRIAADSLAIRGEIHTKILASAIGNIILYKRGHFASIGRMSFTNDEIIDFLDQNPTIRDSVPFGLRASRVLIASVGIACHYLASQIYKEKAEYFWQRLTDGIGLDASDPIYLLRERLIADRTGGTKYRRLLRSVELTALTIKAFNAFISGRPMKQLKWMSQGIHSEGFPTFDGE